MKLLEERIRKDGVIKEEQLKQQITDIGRSARRTAQGLAQFDRSFSQQAAQVEAVIGGSAQNKDREMVAAIEDAKRKVHAAAASLARVTRTADQYSASL